MPTVLLIDDDVKLTESIVLNVAEDQYDWVIAHDGEDGLEKVKSFEPDLIIADIRMPKMDGITLLGKVKELGYEVPVVMITAYEDMETTIKAMQMGAFEYVRKPIDPDELELIMDRALETMKRERRLTHMVQEISANYRINNLVGSTPAMQEIFKTIGQVTTSSVSVLVNGESGTGKELISKAIHYNSPRRESPFIAINCSAIPEGLIESELFGHEKGAFTGAIKQKRGKFELANKGTIFLDEIGSIGLDVQVNLLRVLQEKEFERVGGTQTIKADVRIIAATSKNLEQAVEDETFRGDLYYRLNVFPIYLPPMRERKTDILLLADHFLENYARENSKDIRRFSTPAIDMLMQYHWPGNVRELENSIERAVLLCEGGVIRSYHLPPTLQTGEQSDTLPARSLEEAVAGLEREMIIDALKNTRGNMATATELLQTTVRKFTYKAKKYGVDFRQYR